MSKKLAKILLPILMAVVSVMPVMAKGNGTGVTVDIPVDCVEEGGTFRIEPKENSPAALKDTIKIADGEQGVFRVTYDQPDNYPYVIKQISKGNSSVEYDDSVYDVVVHVMYDKKDQLYAELEVWRDGEKSELSYDNKASKSSDDEEKDNPGKKGSRKDTPGKKSGGSGKTSSGKNSKVKTSDPAEIGKWAVITGSCVILLAVLMVMRVRREIADIRSRNTK